MERRVRAWERLHDPQYSGALDTQAFHSLLLAAGYSEDMAQKASNERGLQRLTMGMKV